jgi:hypothetical protein
MERHIPRQQFGNARDRMIGDVREDKLPFPPTAIT